MLPLPFFWMIKFSGVLHERKGELMILNSKADKNEASAVKGGAFMWKEWVRLQFLYRGVSNLNFMIHREGSMMWHRRKKKLLYTALFKTSIVVFPCSVHGIKSQLQCHPISFFWKELWMLSSYGKYNAQGSGPCCTLTSAKERQSCLLDTSRI